MKTAIRALGMGFNTLGSVGFFFVGPGDWKPQSLKEAQLSQSSWDYGLAFESRSSRDA